ncbi:hypothetical protein [Streptomyces sp. NPDC091278]
MSGSGHRANVKCLEDRALETSPGWIAGFRSQRVVLWRVITIGLGSTRHG